MFLVDRLELWLNDAADIYYVFGTWVQLEVITVQSADSSPSLIDHLFFPPSISFPTLQRSVVAVLSTASCVRGAARR